MENLPKTIGEAVTADRERIIKILLRNEFCFMNEVECPGHGPENCEECARKVIGA